MLFPPLNLFFTMTFDNTTRVLEALNIHYNAPEDYVQVNVYIDTLRQKQMTTEFFNPSRYIQDSPFATLC